MKQLFLFLLLLSTPVFASTFIAGSVIKHDFTPQLVEQRSAEDFVHPGILLSAADMNHIRQMVREGREPWATAFNQFRVATKALKTYQILNRKADGTPKFPVMSEGYGQYDARRDADAAYAQSILWYITGDTDYRDKVLEILRLWYTSIKHPSTDILTAGMAMQKFCFAAEIMRYATGSGWTEADTKAFSSFLRVMLPSNDRPTAFMNQGSIGTMGYMASGVFLDDKEIYANAIDRTTVGSQCTQPIRDYSIKRQIKEVTDSVTGKKGVILVEMGRDQGHAQGDIGALGSLARTAWVQGTRVNEQGKIVADGSGTTVFGFLDNRLLKGAAIVGRYNFGYDEVFYPARFSGEFKGQEFASKVSPAYRGQLHPVYELIYNHYRYQAGASENNPDLKMIKRIVDFYTPEAGHEDFPGDGTLLFTPRERELSVSPKGEPQSIALVDYLQNTKDYGRIQAETFLGSKGNIGLDLKRQHFGNGDVGYRPIIDHEGARRIISEVKEKFYVWYKDIDFGTLPIDRMIMRTAASIGCKMDVILLDKVKNLDLTQVTEEMLTQGEKIATVQIPATGWWTYFTNFSTQLNRKVSGKHHLALRFYGSGHVYTLQATMDWFKFATSYAGEPNAAATARVITGKAPVRDDYRLMNNGAALLFADMDTDSGIEWLDAELASTSPGTIELRKGTDKGELLAMYQIDSTNGQFTRLQCPSYQTNSLKGRTDLCLVYRGEQTLKLKTYRNKPTALQFEPVTASWITIVRSGEAVLGKEYATVKALPEGTSLNFHEVNFMNTPETIAFRVRTQGEAHLSLNNITAKDSMEDAPFLTVDLPDTKGEWQTVYADMKQATKLLKGACMLVATFRGESTMLDFAGMQFDPLVETQPGEIHSGRIEVGKGSLYYEEMGKGEPVIFVHGHSLTHRMWDEQFAAFAGKYRAIRYDLRGYGASSPQTENEQFTHVEDLVKLMDVLHIKKAHIVGLSLGGYIGADMLGWFPERIQSVVLASGNVRQSPGPSEPMGKEEAQKRDAEIAALKKKGVEVMKREWLEGLIKSGGTQRERMRKPLTEMISAWDAWQPLHKEVRVVAGRDAYAKLKAKRPQVPALIVEGRSPDNRFPEHPQILNYLPQGKMIVLNDCGHMLNMEQPEAFNKNVMAFIEENK